MPLSFEISSIGLATQGIKAWSQFWKLQTPLTNADNSMVCNLPHLQRSPILRVWTPTSGSPLSEDGEKPFPGDTARTEQVTSFRQNEKGCVTCPQPGHLLNGCCCIQGWRNSGACSCPALTADRAKWLCGILSPAGKKKKKIVCNPLSSESRSSW